MFPEKSSMMLTRHEFGKDVLARRMVRPVYLSPRHADFVRPSSAQSMLPEEEHKSSTIFVHRSTVLLNHADTFNDVNKLELLLS